MQDIRQNANDFESVQTIFLPHLFQLSDWIPHKLTASDKQTESEPFGKQSLKYLNCASVFF